MRSAILLLLICFQLLATAQRNKTDSLCIISYNVENLFDCKDDTLKNDQEFLPNGKKYWTTNKYKHKLNRIARVIISIGKWDTPALVGLYEVENEKTLNALTNYSNLKNLRYKYIHQESPDRRGIDVALLYQPNKFKPITSKFFRISIPTNKRTKTRDLLYTSGEVANGDTLHVFACHFPSRYGGEKKSEPKRIYVASFLKSKVDSIKKENPSANILIMGDFNDFPNNKSMKDVLKANKPDQKVSSNNLYNLAYPYHDEGKIGTNKYKGIWGMLDQIIVSGNMLSATNSLYIKEKKMYICHEPFLFEEDTKHLGNKPFRTYIGYKYNNGYSDHLPIYINIILR